MADLNLDWTIARCRLSRADPQVGIVVLTTGSIIPGMYYAFHGQKSLQIFYICMFVFAMSRQEVTLIFSCDRRSGHLGLIREDTPLYK